MKSIAFFLVASSLAFAPLAFAQDPGSPPPPPPPVIIIQQSPPTVVTAPTRAPEAPPEAPAVDAPPPPRTGFQMSLRTGYLIPMGSVMKNADMSRTFGGQVPLLVDLGFKPDPHVFVGGYVGLGFGGAGSDPCNSCVAASFRVGLEAQYHFSPGEKINPWLGYGIGLESTGVGDDKNDFFGVAGVEYAHLMAGLDFRLSRSVGIGPLLDFSMGQYSHLRRDQAGLTREADIKDTTTHEWLLIGGRLVIFP